MRISDSETSWDEVSRLLRDVGRETYLAERIAAERKARGMSQEKLAKAMTDVGCPIPQSAVSKIENPAAGGRRAITVDEAIALSRVFDVPLAQLLLPDGALANVQIHRLLAYGPEKRQQAHHAMRGYQVFLEQLAADMKGSDGWDLYVHEALKKAQEELQAVQSKPRERGSSRRYEAVQRIEQQVAFLRDLAKELDGE